MSNTNRALVHEHTGRAQRFATGFGIDNTVIAGMSTGITRPKSVEHKLEDIARGRTVDAWRHVPEIAEACIQEGGSFFHISRPLAVMMAHLRRRCSNKMPLDIKSALVTAQREESEAECAELNLALSVNGPEHSVLLAFVKEEREALVAKEHVVELAEDLLAAREQS